mmetsp:Transcript_33989/g.97920  ORF Transcript_33989/g.97920 Transcript_33989/m.97920 type:complete len:797 (-) Transcript_33989:89-2479(-)
MGPLSAELTSVLTHAACGMDIEDSAQRLLSQMTLKEKVGVLSGAGMWENHGVPRLGLQSLRVTDGPHGARGLSLRGSAGALLAPCETALAATFNEGLVEQVGEVLGAECRRRGADVLLGPCLNLQRFPNSGRHFECFSEDPLLSARMGAAYVRGVQKFAVACAKHFACNDQETDRGTQNSVVDERTLHEVYLAPFEAAVVDGEVGAMMCGYNRLNGSYCTENEWLLDHVLRSRWGFRGIVMSDWFGNLATERSIRAGLNLEMPGIEPRHYGGYLADAVRRGSVTVEELDRRVLPMLCLLLRLREQAAPPLPSALEDDLLSKAAAQSCVLLRNKRGALPLNIAELRRVAVIGPNAASTVIQGGGSSRVHPRPAASLLDVLRCKLSGVEVTHTDGCSWEMLGWGEQSLETAGLYSMGGSSASGQPAPFSLAGIAAAVNDIALVVGAWISGCEPFRRCLMPILRRCGWRLTTLEEATQAAAQRAEAARGREVVTERRPTCFAGDEALLAEAEAQARQADACVLVVGTHGFWELEGVDQPHTRLLGRQDELITRVARAARGKVIVVLNIGSPKQLPWLHDVDAVLVAYFGGQGIASAVASVLLGGVNPAGRLPTTWPQDISAVAARLASARRSEPVQPGDVPYDERLNVGYRGVQKDRPPLFHFGHGLSYTTFSSGALRVEQTRRCGEVGGPQAVARLVVRNEGARAGAHVVQLYTEVLTDASAPHSAPRSLRGFQRTAELSPGGEEEVCVELGPRALGAWYDVASSSWASPAAGWRVRIAACESAADDQVLSQVDLDLA